MQNAIWIITEILCDLNIGSIEYNNLMETQYRYHWEIA